jgi:hypothetical protein
VIGVFREGLPLREAEQHLRLGNRIIAVLASVAGRMSGDQYHRLDRITFRVPDLKAMATSPRSWPRW